MTLIEWVGVCSSNFDLVPGFDFPGPEFGLQRMTSQGLTAELKLQMAR
jgi:hypothetical protein